jgi:hypothetical protein
MANVTAKYSPNKAANRDTAPFAGDRPAPRPCHPKTMPEV